MQVTYYVDDGYANCQGRPHHVLVNDSDLEGCETEEERIKIIEEAIEDHFRQNVLWYWHRNLK